MGSTTVSRYCLIVQCAGPSNSHIVQVQCSSISCLYSVQEQHTCTVFRVWFDIRGPESLETILPICECLKLIFYVFI